MIRQNKDGRPIYKDWVWFRMVETGKKLRKLGYEESRTKLNLFYKPINTEVKSKDRKYNIVKGAVFADLRGTDIIPIWSDSRPLIYFTDLPFNIFIPEFILLERSGCSPRVSFYDDCEPDGWMFGLDGIPSGFCKRCGVEIIDEVDWEILRKDFIELYSQGIDQNLEVQYCETCRKIEYSMRDYRLQHYEDFKSCQLCGTKEGQVRHHINYNPEKIIRICRSCHGKIHHKGFPNPLWKERRNQNQESI